MNHSKSGGGYGPPRILNTCLHLESCRSLRDGSTAYQSCHQNRTFEFSLLDYFLDGHSAHKLVPCGHARSALSRGHLTFRSLEDHHGPSLIPVNAAVPPRWAGTRTEQGTNLPSETSQTPSHLVTSFSNLRHHVFRGPSHALASLTIVVYA